MRQIIQYQKNGTMLIENVPAPVLRREGVLVQNAYSLISAGTERASVTTAKASWIGKARSRPDLVKQVLNNAKREGWLATYAKVRNRLDNYKELGYSSAGIVIESAVEGIAVGAHVACGGAGYASHAEIIAVPKNLVAPVPQGVTMKEAAFTTVGAIALQGVRQAEVHIGETVAVIGLGLIGLMTVQLLKSSGCRVLGFDVQRSNFTLARSMGCDECILVGADALRRVDTSTFGVGTDAVIITAATLSNEPIELALHMARKRSRIVFVGAVGMNIPRSPFYEKELELRQSCSYGPGRYDPGYEELGADYPVAYVRWTEQRNMTAVLRLMASKKLDVMPLITHTFQIERGLEAYDLITSKKKHRYLAVLIEYPGEVKHLATTVTVGESTPGIKPPGQVVIGFIGAGNFAQSYLLPPLKKLGIPLRGVMTGRPVTANTVARKFGFQYCTTDLSALVTDGEINAVFIASRHDTHGKYVMESLKKGKNVFVEKPLAISHDELDAIRKTYLGISAEHRPHLMVGFNRRFSYPFRDIKEFIGETGEPLGILYRVHAGVLPPGHWMQALEQGGRVIGEACHFIDCMLYLTGARPVSVSAEALREPRSEGRAIDNVSVQIGFSDGSVGTLLYLTNGDPSVPKEYCEIYSGGKTAIMDNFATVTFHANGRRRKKSYDMRKGHAEEVEHFIRLVAGREKPELPFDTVYLVTLTTLRILDAVQRRGVVNV